MESVIVPGVRVTTQTFLAVPWAISLLAGALSAVIPAGPEIIPKDPRAKRERWETVLGRPMAGGSLLMPVAAPGSPRGPPSWQRNRRESPLNTPRRSRTRNITRVVWPLRALMHRPPGQLWMVGGQASTPLRRRGKPTAEASRWSSSRRRARTPRCRRKNRRRKNLLGLLRLSLRTSATRRTSPGPVFPVRPNNSTPTPRLNFTDFPHPPPPRSWG